MENICVDASMKPKFVDFGLSKQNAPIGTESSTFCGTYPYLPPEMIFGPSYTNAVDFWQLGVIMYLMEYRRLPFFSEDDDVLYKKICYDEPIYPKRESPFKKLVMGNI